MLSGRTNLPRADEADAAILVANCPVCHQTVSRVADWTLDYCNVERLSADEIARRRAAFDAAKVRIHRQRNGSAAP